MMMMVSFMCVHFLSPPRGGHALFPTTPPSLVSLFLCWLPNSSSSPSLILIPFSHPFLSRSKTHRVNSSTTLLRSPCSSTAAYVGCDKRYPFRTVMQHGGYISASAGQPPRQPHKSEYLFNRLSSSALCTSFARHLMSPSACLEFAYAIGQLRVMTRLLQLSLSYFFD